MPSYQERWGRNRSKTRNGKSLERAKKREEATIRNKLWNKLSDEEKIAKLILRPGNCAKQLGILLTRN